MEIDDVMPNDGSYFLPREPIDQQISRKKDLAKTLESQAVLKMVAERFKDEIEFYSSVDSISDQAKLDPQKFLIQHNANEIVRDVLANQKEYIESLLDSAGVGEI